MAILDKNDIPVKLNLLREYMEDSDPAIGTYNIGYHQYHCLCPNEDAEMLDLGGAIEDTLHDLKDYGFADSDIREIMGLELGTDPDTQEYGEEYPDEYTPIDLGWLLHSGDMSFFEVIPPEECAAQLRTRLSDAQIELAVQALDRGEGIRAAMDALDCGKDTQRPSLNDAAKESRAASTELVDGKTAEAPALDQNR